MVKSRKYFFLAIILIISGCYSPAVEPSVNGAAENNVFVEQPRYVSILVGDGSPLSLTLYPNANALTGIVLVSLDESLWVDEIPVIQEEYEVLFLSGGFAENVEDAYDYLSLRRELENIFIVSHGVELPLDTDKYLVVDVASAVYVKEKIKGFIYNK